MGPEQQRLTPAERSNLVAYLDGELNEAESRAIATKLTKSPTARREVEALEKTWEMLELLPRPRASEALTARTLTEVKQLSVAGDQFQSAVLRRARGVLRSGLWVAAGLGALGLGFVLTRWIWPNPTARLVEDLSIAEHFDEYQDAGSWEFLDQLVHSPEFGADSD